MFAIRAFGGLFTLAALTLSLPIVMGAQQKAERGKAAERGEGARKGVVTGVVTAKGKTWIEVKGDGEERARRYVPHWRGDAPASGGGPDKEVVAKIAEVRVHSRVQLDWVFEERPRVEKIEVLGNGPDAGKDAPDHGKRSGTIAGEVKSKRPLGENVAIEVLAPGEEKARSYHVKYDPKAKGPIPEVLGAVRAAGVGDQVTFDWEATHHGPAIVRFEVQKKADEKKGK